MDMYHDDLTKNAYALANEAHGVLISVSTPTETNEKIQYAIANGIVSIALSLAAAQVKELEK
ncbi:Uncharacterised protein [Mycobacteroides abscessus subsp. bolletii]|uniref:hypothetical protein n=1 Tax=Mycobacteroides abscessus TaxID=36809 RepID=UPI00078C36A0|nr:hypothetical protein [Mycobacteroides abscessus]AMU74039.1 hypothetical protein A3O06_04720 [Mycobacteroides abscessus]ANO22975.1 hypothetical protein BAB79_04720 [Mycobacteroides abscessus]SKG76929.1 Uncharacterised protein [Mycobacteroides abscessus subsp. bolletii]SKH07889.1 Uncharacterised protein [Mycobacteroides abscessus subsp. bolletii]